MKWFDRTLLWPLLLTCHLLAVTLVAWHLLAQVNFGYALAYPTLSIEQHIQAFGPSNHFKEHFGSTDPEEHRVLFAEIVRAVQNRGRGLEDITYSLPDGGREILLREPEVIHLQDVATLIQRFYITTIAASALLILLLFYARRRGLHPPPLKKILLFMGGTTLSGVFIVFLLTPVRVFYWLHEIIFPAEHDWFFYYEESLMTTLMKAPDLFGFIAILLLLLITVIWLLSLRGMHWVLQGTGESAAQDGVQPGGKPSGKPRKQTVKGKRSRKN